MQKVDQVPRREEPSEAQLDGFNLFNVNTITAYASGNQSVAGFTQPSTIVPPRVFRVGASLNF